MPYSDHEQALRVASALSAVATGCCLRYGLFASVYRQPLVTLEPTEDAFRRYYDLSRTLALSTTEDLSHPPCTWLICRIEVPEPAERYFLHGYHHWLVEWVEVVSIDGLLLPTDPVLLALQGIEGLLEGPRDHGEDSGRTRLVARPLAVSLDAVAERYARATAGIGTDQLWTALRQYGAARAPLM